MTHPFTRVVSPSARRNRGATPRSAGSGCRDFWRRTRERRRSMPVRHDAWSDLSCILLWLHARCLTVSQKKSRGKTAIAGKSLPRFLAAYARTPPKNAAASRRVVRFQRRSSLASCASFHRQPEEIAGKNRDRREVAAAISGGVRAYAAEACRCVTTRGAISAAFFSGYR